MQGSHRHLRDPPGDAAIRILVPGEVLEAGAVLPELRVPVEEVFEELDADLS